MFRSLVLKTCLDFCGDLVIGMQLVMFLYSTWCEMGYVCCFCGALEGGECYK